MAVVTQGAETAVSRLDVSVYTVPTDTPESDGTFESDSTTLILVEAHAGDCIGLGWTYGAPATAKLIKVSRSAGTATRPALARRLWAGAGCSAGGVWLIVMRAFRRRARASPS
jgi:hypothetical protein